MERFTPSLLNRYKRILCLLFPFAVLSVIANVSAHEGQDEILINAGGPGFTDSLGRVWTADSFFNAGNSFTNFVSIAGTQDDILYQTERWDSSGSPELKYSVPVENGNYEVKLHFSDIYSETQGVGKRIFDIHIEGEKKEDDLDIYSLAGGYTALIKSYNTTVSDGYLDITFGHEVENPKVSGIEIHLLSVAPTPTIIPTPAISLTPTRTPTPTPTPPSNLQAYYPFSEGSGTFAGDSSGNSNHGAVNGATWATGRNGGGLSFDGMDDYINLGNPSSLQPSTVSLSAWFKTSVSGKTILRKRLYGYGLEVTSSGKIAFWIYNAAATKFMATSSAMYNDNVWHHAVGVYDGSTVKLYIDGSLIATSGAGTIYYGTGGIAIGRDGDYNGSYFNGLVDEVRIYGKTLTDQEVLDLYTLYPPIPTPTPSPTPTPTSNLLFEYRINAGGGNYTDSNGKNWVADIHYNSGNSYSTNNSISGTTDDVIYQTERWDQDTSPELEYSIIIPNGDYDINLHFADIYSGTQYVGARVFDVSIEGVLVLNDYDIFSDVGGYAASIKSFSVSITDGELNIMFGHVVENPKLSGIEILSVNTTSNHLVHAVAGSDTTVVDIENSGSESVFLNGSFSHTHAFGEELVSWIWTEGGNTILTSETGTVSLAVGVHNIELYVEDGAGNSATDDIVVTVLSPINIHGFSTYFYDFHDTPLSNIPNTSGMKPDFALISDNINYSSTTDVFGGSPYFDHFTTKFVGLINVPQDGNYGFAIESDDGSTLYIDGNLIINNDGTHAMIKKSGSLYLTTGKHPITVEFFDNTDGAGLKLYWTKPGSTEQVVPMSNIFQNYSERLPVLNSILPVNGQTAGGDKVTLNGFGFIHPVSQISVNFGGVVLNDAQITKLNDAMIEVYAPEGIEGQSVNISVSTPNGTSNVKSYRYSNNSLPAIQFNQGQLLSGITGPTSLAFGPDGKLYVGTQNGDIVRITFDDNLNVTETFTSNIIQTSEPTFRSILGIAFNPLDDPANPKVYVSHSQLFHGQTIDYYTGKISTVSGPNLDVKTDLIINLPVSDHDHGVNGIEFDHYGDMHFEVGGNTNAGVPGALSSSGQLDEGYFSAASLVAHIYDPLFNGNLTYDADGYPTGGHGIEVFASGFRNSFDILSHSNGKLYATDNGPNTGYGQKSTDCTSSGSDPTEGDELNLVVQGKYYGHANRLRGEFDPRQCIWKSIIDAPSPDYTPPITTFPSSTDGLVEYWTNNFAGQMKGHILASRWKGELFEIILSNDGTEVNSNSILSSSGGLDVAVSPEGIIFVAQNDANKITYHKPVEVAPAGLNITSVFPYKGTWDGGREVTIRGNNFGSGLHVHFAGKECEITYSDSNRIVCTTPASRVRGAVDVEVVSNGASKVLKDGYVYVGYQNSISVREEWETLANLPVELGEVSAAVLNNELYLFAGHDGSQNENKKLFKYDHVNNSWIQLADQNVIPASDHVTAQSIDGKLYIFGGINSSGESNKLGIYDPLTNSWSEGAPLKKHGVDFGLGSSASAVIDGKLYVAGGIHADTTVNTAFVYDPIINSWTEIAPIPEGRNHAAGGSFAGKFYVFGGRCCGGSWPGIGYTNAFVYDPTTESWSEAASMLTGRGGMGNAPLYNGELIVIGGEGSGPYHGTFPNVEAYNPITNTWRILPDLITPRHGIYPVTVGNKIHVVAGGKAEGFSYSNIHEALVFNVSPNPTPTPAPNNAIRINAGGGAFTDSIGNSWQGDLNYNTGKVYSTTHSISNTSNQSLYQTERWDEDVLPELNYSFSLANGEYRVILHFADIYSETHSVGARIFDVIIENNIVLDDYDIFAEVGGYVAISKSFTVTVSDGSLDILFAHVIENPKISGIEILPVQF